jgi:hypothetical protein
MEKQKHARFRSANQELRGFLRQAEGLAKKTGTVTAAELETISLSLTNVAPEIGDASRSETLDLTLQSEVGEYVKNLSALQTTVENVRSHVLARRVEWMLKVRFTDRPEVLQQTR